MNNKILKLVSIAINKIIKNVFTLHYMGRYHQYRGQYELHRTFRFNGDDILFYGNGKINAGEGSYIGSYSSIQSADDCTVSIGSNCEISHFVNIYTSNHAADKDYSCDNTMRSGDVLIGDFCWLGIKATIIGPVKIGENTCVAANSLVNRDLPPHSIAIGVPAKVVKFKSYLSEYQLTRLVDDYKHVISDDLLAKLGY